MGGASGHIYIVKNTNLEFKKGTYKEKIGVPVLTESIDTRETVLEEKDNCISRDIRICGNINSLTDLVAKKKKKNRDGGCETAHKLL